MMEKRGEKTIVLNFESKYLGVYTLYRFTHKGRDFNNDLKLFTYDDLKV